MASTLQFLSRNWLTSGTLLTPYPAALLDYPATNVLLPDRYTPWAHPGGGEAATLTIDMGAARTVRVVAALGITYSGSVGFPNGWYALLGSTNPPVDYMTPMQLLTSTPRDSLYVLPSPVTYRYVQFVFNFPLLSFSVGKVAAGMWADLGLSYSPGSTEVFIRQRSRTMMANGAPVIATTGYPRKRLQYQFNRVQRVTRDNLVTLCGCNEGTSVSSMPSPGLILTPGGYPYEVEPANDGVTVSHVWGAPDLYDVAVELDTLP